MRNLVTGGAGFLGSHLIDRLINVSEEVICLDNYFTGRKKNIEKWLGNKNFELIRHDVINPIQLEVDRVQEKWGTIICQQCTPRVKSCEDIWSQG